MTEPTYKLIHGDCLEAMKDIPDGSVDMCLTDPPYGTTACKWDSVIPFEPMWKELKRIVKPKGAICLFGSQPFTSTLVGSNLDGFRYEWVWEKEQGVNFQLAKIQPLKAHENIVMFANESMRYFPQGTQNCNITKSNINKTTHLAHLASEKHRAQYVQTVTNYPKSIIKFNRERGLHPTQKPVELLRYLLKTYTLEGEAVLDFTMGSGSTGVACMLENRKFIGIEKDANYFEIAKNRIEQCLTKEPLLAYA